MSEELNMSTRLARLEAVSELAKETSLANNKQLLIVSEGIARLNGAFPEIKSFMGNFEKRILESFNPSACAERHKDLGDCTKITSSLSSSVKTLKWIFGIQIGLNVALWVAFLAHVAK